MEAVRRLIGKAGRSRLPVLLLGETGTGKEVVARAIHAVNGAPSGRGRFVPIDCGSLVGTLMESELFGHVKGSFSGAAENKKGLVELADSGTAFFDEIGDLPLEMQVKLLRLMQESEFRAVGSLEWRRVDLRIIAATHRDLKAEVAAGRFRQDLYYRLNVFQIALPPLREHMEDLAALADHFVAKVCASEKLPPKMPDASALDRLAAHSWPGNVRELENAIEMAVILSGTRPIIFASDIRIAAESAQRGRPEPAGRTVLPAGGLDYQHALESYELDLLTQALTRTRGNKTAAAELLGLKRTTLSARMRVLESRLPRLVA